MNNYELDKKAKELVDSETPYNLARRVVELESRYDIEGDDAGFKNDMKAKFIMEQNTPYKVAKEVVRLGNLIQSFDMNKEWLHVNDMRPNNGDLVALTDDLQMKRHHELLDCELCVYQDGEFWTSPPDGDESIPFNLNVDYWWKLVHRA